MITTPGRNSATTSSTLGSSERGFADTTLVINGIASGGAPPDGNPIPLPPAAWAGLVTLAGMGAEMRVKKARKID